MIANIIDIPIAVRACNKPIGTIAAIIQDDIVIAVATATNINGNIQVAFLPKILSVITIAVAILCRESPIIANTPAIAIAVKACKTPIGTICLIIQDDIVTAVAMATIIRGTTQRFLVPNIL